MKLSGYDVGDKIELYPYIYLGDTQITLAGNTNMDFLEPGYIIGQSGSSDSGPIDAIDSASNTITLEGLVDFTVGSPVFSSVSASATCMGYDPTANTMLISGTEGKWAVNQGKFVEGTVKRLPKYQSETSELVAVGSVPGEYQIEQSLIIRWLSVQDTRCNW